MAEAERPMPPSIIENTWPQGRRLWLCRSYFITVVTMGGLRGVARYVEQRGGYDANKETQPHRYDLAARGTRTLT